MNWMLLIFALFALAATALMWRAGVGFLRRWAAVVELILAIVLLAVLVVIVVGDRSGPGLIFVAVALGVVLVGRDVLRDYLSGVRVRAGRLVEQGDALTVGDVDGVVSRIGRLSLSIEDERGSVVVPHTRVASAVVRQRTQRSGARPHRFEISWSGPTGQVRAATVVERAALLDPWCAAGHDILIEPLGPRRIAVTVHALDGTHAFAIEATMRRALDEECAGLNQIEAVATQRVGS